jgi:hypothetical protein
VRFLSPRPWCCASSWLASCALVGRMGVCVVVVVVVVCVGGCLLVFIKLKRYASHRGRRLAADGAPRPHLHDVAQRRRERRCRRVLLATPRRKRLGIPRAGVRAGGGVRRHLGHAGFERRGKAHGPALACRR